MRNGVETVVDDDHGLLGQQIATRVLSLYVSTFGGLDGLLAGSGVEVSAEFARVGSTRGISAGALIKLCHRAVNELAAHEHHRVGRAGFRRADWQVILYSLTSARTLRQGIERCTECFEAIDWRYGRLSLRASGARAELHLDPGPDAEGIAAGFTSVLIALYGVAAIHDLFRSAIAQPLPVQQVCLDHPARQFDALGLPPLPFPVVLDAGWTGFAFSASYLDHPIACSAEDRSMRGPGSFLFQPPEDASRPEAVGELVRRLVLRALRERQRLPGFDEIVETLGGSAATLRRRLAGEGVTYREIKDSCRRELGLDLLRRSNLPIEDIAVRLDFCDSDAFRRAFRDWIGMPPSAYRRQAQLGPATP